MTAASLVIVNARVRTGHRTRPQAEALAVRDGRLAAVGSAAEAMKLVTPTTRVVDARGRTVRPVDADDDGDDAAGDTEGAAPTAAATLTLNHPADFVVEDGDGTVVLRVINGVIETDALQGPQH